MPNFIIMKKTLFLTLALVMLSCVTALAQVNFSVNYKKVSANEIDIVFSGKADAGWHVYSTSQPDGGPNPAIFGVDKKDGVELVGGLKPGAGAKTAFDPMFEMNITYFENTCSFTQRVRLTKKDYSLKGYLEYSACNDMSCLPPTTVACKLQGKDGPVPAGEAKAEEAKKKAEEALKAAADDAKKKAEDDLKAAEEANKADLALATDTTSQDTAAVVPAVANGDNKLNMDALWTPVIDKLEEFGEENIADHSLWYIFIMGFLGGLVALFTPCVWPIIPMTVSFFLKRAGNRSKGIRDAVIYGISIIVIYVGLGLIITTLFGANALNDLSTNAFFNILFFLMLVVFAASFFGGFEISLPSSWGAAIDGKAEKATGLLSIFLMAFTLALVSFSCTGPIIGFLLVEVSTSGGTALAPTIGMLGFAVALALPFSLFAMFPALLKSAPKSGGWLNTVKVTLGFLELAFALKFFSVADLAYGWGIMDREVFLSLWIIIFAMLGIYLLGWLRFPHDDETNHTSVPRFFLALFPLAFAIYMIPGLWGAPCKAISAFAPPISTQDFNLAPEQIKSFKNYEEGMEYARKVGKPVFLDFTGHGCVNCRKMEAAVWESPAVKEKMEEDYVVISLYVDEKEKLAEPIEVEVGGTERRLRTVGDKWSYLQQHKFGANAQPFYVLVDHEGNPLNQSYSYDEDIEKFLQFLNKGKENFDKQK